MARKRGRSVGDVARYTGRATTAPPSFQGDDDDTVTSGTTFGLIALVAFLAICFMAVRFGTQAIESDLEARAGRAVVAAGFELVEVTARGTTVELSGSYVDGQVEEQAFEAASVDGATDVTGQIWLISTDELDAAVVRGEPFEASWADGTLIIEGELSTEEKVALVTATLDDDGDGYLNVDNPEMVRLELVTSDLRMKEGLDEEPWIGSALALLRSATEKLATGLLRVDGENRYVAVSGEVLEKDVGDELNDAVVALGTEFGFDATPGVLLIRTGPTEEEVEELQEELNELILDQVVEFEVKSFELTEKGTALLDEVLVALAAAPEVRVLITGHTDDRGGVEENQLLSEQRAKAVLDYLVAKGEDPARFDTIAYGESQPIETNDTEEGRARNRRIEFTALLDDLLEEE